MNIEELINTPVQYYLNMKGKNIRNEICNFLGTLFFIEIEDIESINNIINVIHNASLVIDDIEDNSFLRRSQDCAHIKYGIPLSINSGYLSVFKVLHEFNKQENIDFEIKFKIVENLYYGHVGQGLDIYYSKEKIIPSLEEYNKMVEYKTGLIFISILDLIMSKTNNVILKKRYPSLLIALNKLSCLFQSRDDFINITDPNYWKEKGFCEDFDEQKISYIIVMLNNNKLPNYKIINKLLFKNSKSVEDKVNLLLLIQYSGVLELVYDNLIILKTEILSIINIEMIFDKIPFSKFNKDSIEIFFKPEKN
jgi:geranylgeranyl diphosphate synthase type 3